VRVDPGETRPGLVLQAERPGGVPAEDLRDKPGEAEQAEAPGVARLPVATEELRNALAGAVQGVDGVARLEPTPRDALRRLQAGTTVLLNDGAPAPRRRDRAARRGDVVDVHVDVVTTRSGLRRPARATCAGR